jgi:hypothetical protein
LVNTSTGYTLFELNYRWLLQFIAVKPETSAFPGVQKWAQQAAENLE